MQQKLLFLIPVYRHNPERVISEIRRLFPNSEIIIIDDGEGLNITICFLDTLGSLKMQNTFLLLTFSKLTLSLNISKL